MTAPDWMATLYVAVLAPLLAWVLVAKWLDGEDQPGDSMKFLLSIVALALICVPASAQFGGLHHGRPGGKNHHGSFNHHFHGFGNQFGFRAGGFGGYGNFSNFGNYGMGGFNANFSSFADPCEVPPQPSFQSSYVQQQSFAQDRVLVRDVPVPVGNGGGVIINNNVNQRGGLLGGGLLGRLLDRRHR